MIDGDWVEGKVHPCLRRRRRTKKLYAIHRVETDDGVYLIGVDGEPRWRDLEWHVVMRASEEEDDEEGHGWDCTADSLTRTEQDCTRRTRANDAQENTRNVRQRSWVPEEWRQGMGDGIGSRDDGRPGMQHGQGPRGERQEQNENPRQQGNKRRRSEAEKLAEQAWAAGPASSISMDVAVDRNKKRITRRGATTKRRRDNWEQQRPTAAKIQQLMATAVWIEMAGGQWPPEPTSAGPVWPGAGPGPAPPQRCGGSLDRGGGVVAVKELGRNEAEPG